MRKGITLWVSLLVLFLGFTVAGPVVLADEEYYWKDFMETAAIDYDHYGTEMEFFTKIMEENEGKAVDNGMDLELDFRFGLFKDGQLHSYLYSEDSTTNIIGEYQQRLIHKPSLDIAFKGRLFYEDNSLIPSVKLLTDKTLNEHTIVHNNLQLFFYDSGIIRKRIENGLTYTINPKNFLKLRLKTSFDNNLLEGTFDFRVAYKNIVNEQTNLIMYSYYEKDETIAPDGNLHLESIVQFTPIKPLLISVNAIVNSLEVKSNWVFVRAEYSFNDQWKIEGEFRKELAKDGYRFVKSGFTFKI